MTIEDLKILAEAKGYSWGYAQMRLAYGSFVSCSGKYIYMETPKAACSALKKMIMELEGAKFQGSKSVMFPQQQSRLDMLIHERNRIDMPTIDSLSEADLAEVMDKDSEWFFFAMVRNPFSRLVSFYESKVRLAEPGYSRWEQQFGDPEPHGGLQQAFSKFVFHVVSKKPLNDGHLSVQKHLLMPELLPYSDIFKLEDNAALFERWAAHLKSVRKDNAVLPDFERVNTSIRKRNWRGYYDSDTAKAVARVYAVDFETFGYDPEDWKPQSSSQDFEDLEYEKIWRKEIVQRNNFIQYLYKLHKLTYSSKTRH